MKNGGAIPPLSHMPTFIKHGEDFAVFYFFTILLRGHMMA
jgi:hypothetical protein